MAAARTDVIALHDCDIVSYSRVTDRMHGRVTRLLITPLIRALQKLVGGHDFLAFLDSFRYPLAGEFCMTTDLAWVNRIPWDWGLEVGVLSEVFRNYSPGGSARSTYQIIMSTSTSPCPQMTRARVS